jgi:hypothetical protein
MNLYQKIVEVRKSIDGFSKDKRGFGYDYVSGNQILGAIRGKMDELGLILVPSTQSGPHETFHYTNEKGKEKTDMVVKGDMAYTWINADNPEEKYTTAWAYYGQQDDVSKAFGSALTYSERYYLLKFFGIPTDADDPDSQDTRGKKGTPPPMPETYSCAGCGNLFKDTTYKGKQYTAKEMHDGAVDKYGKAFCSVCGAKHLDGMKQIDKANKGFDKALGGVK